MAYVPSLHTSVSKPIGIQGNATDARSRYYDATLFKYRDYVSTAEVIAYLTTASHRTGGFPIFINSTGTLSNGVITGGERVEYWFKNGTGDGDLIVKSSGGGGTTDYNELDNLPTLGTAAALDVPASGNAASGEVVKGSDTRLSDSRTPLTHTHTKLQITDLGSIGTAAALNVPTSGDAASGEVVKGDDSRLSDSRTPTSHNHAASDITSGTFSDARIAASNVTQHAASLTGIPQSGVTNLTADLSGKLLGTLATDGETQITSAVSEDNKFVSRLKLFNWWAWVKTQTQSISAIWTHSDLIKYSSDLSGSYDSRTLVDKAYADTKQTALTDTNFGSFSNGLTGKTTPVDADTINLIDSADSNKAKKLTWANLLTALGVSNKLDALVTIEDIGVAVTAYTAVEADKNKYKIYSAGVAGSITLPTSLSTGWSCIFTQSHVSGQITFTAGSGATIISEGSRFKTSSKDSMVTVIKISATTYHLAGGLTV